MENCVKGSVATEHIQYTVEYTYKKGWIFVETSLNHKTKLFWFWGLGGLHCHEGTCVDSVSLSMTSWWSVSWGPDPSGLGQNIGGNTPPGKIISKMKFSTKYAQLRIKNRFVSAQKCLS